MSESGKLKLFYFYKFIKCNICGKKKMQYLISEIFVPFYTFLSPALEKYIASLKSLCTLVINTSIKLQNLK